MKVLHIHTRAIIGGSGRETLLTLDGLPGDRFNGHLACGHEGDLASFINQSRSKDLTFHIIPHLFNRINILNDTWAFFEIIRLIKRQRYIIVHTHNSKAGILGRLAAWICRVPIIVHTIHSCPFNYEGVSYCMRKVFLFLEKFAALVTDHFIAASEHLKEEFVNKGIAKQEKISVIYSGIQIEEFRKDVNEAEKKKELNIPSNNLVVGVVARLEQGKGHKYIIEAIPRILSRCKNVTFLFVGEGSLKSRLMDMANRVNIDKHVIFTGLRTDIPQILRIIDIFCLASFYEGMGRTVLEAQAAGKPVIATEVGGIPDIVEKDKTAILIEPNSVSSISEALMRLIEDENLRRQMGNASRSFIDDRFSSSKMVSSIVHLYDKLIAL